MMYKLYESEIKKIKENIKNFKNDISSVSEIVLKMEKRITDRFKELDKSINDLEKENGELREENKQTVSLVKELLEKLGYEYKMVSNDDYMKAYKVTLTKDERNNIERSKGKSK